MIREAILVTFVAVDIYKTVANGRRKRRASKFHGLFACLDTWVFIALTLAFLMLLHLT